MPSNRFEEKLRQRFEGASFTPSPQVWENIAKEVVSPPRKDRRILPLFFLAAAASALLLMGLFHRLSTPADLSPEVPIASTTPSLPPPVQFESPASQATGQNNPGIIHEESGLELPVYSEGQSQSGEQASQRLTSMLESPSLENNSVAVSAAQSKTEINGSASELPQKQTPATSQAYAQFALSQVQPSLYLEQGTHDLGSTYMGHQAVVGASEYLPRRPAPRWAAGLSVVQGSQPYTSAVRIERNIARENLEPNPGVSSDFVTASSKINMPTTFSGFQLFAEYYVSRALSLQSGLGIVYYHQGAFSGFAKADEDFTNVGPPTAESITNELSYTVAEIPFLANFYLGKKRSSLKISGGFAYQALLSREPSVKYAYTTGANNALSASTTQEGGLVNNHLLRGMGKIQYQYRLGHNMALFAGPVFNYNLTATLDNQAANDNPGLAAGLEFGLKLFLGT